MTTPSPDPTDPLDAPTAALAAAVLEVSRHVETEALPRPRWYALARQAELLADSPASPPCWASRARPPRTRSR